MQMDLAFSEEGILNENLDLIKSLTRTTNISIIPFDEKNKPKGIKQAPIPGVPVFQCD